MNAVIVSALALSLLHLPVTSAITRTYYTDDKCTVLDGATSSSVTPPYPTNYLSNPRVFPIGKCVQNLDTSMWSQTNEWIKMNSCDAATAQNPEWVTGYAYPTASCSYSDAQVIGGGATNTCSRYCVGNLLALRCGYYKYTCASASSTALALMSVAAAVFAFCI